jgi:hypothetical protein
MTAPVVLYYRWQKGELTDAKGKPYKTHIATGIEIWTVNADSVGQLSGFVSADTIKAAVKAGVDAVIYDENGVVIGWSPSKYFWLTGPGSYTFKWKSSPPF